MLTAADRERIARDRERICHEANLRRQAAWKFHRLRYAEEVEEINNQERHAAPRKLSYRRIA